MHIVGDRNGDGGDGRAMPCGDEIVISGMSGQFPESENVTEFMENLYNKVNMVMEVQSEIMHPDYPKYLGKILDTDKFDAHFFKVTYRQAYSLDPMCRLLMKHAYGAIYDSGINPLQMSGKKLGVFIASSNVGDQHMLLNTKKKSSNMFFLTGCSKSMYANRISYWIKSKSPSYYIDCACAGSLAVVHLAYNNILSGDCDAALVGGCNLCINSTVTVNLKNAGLLCSDGKTKCFDKDGDGYARSESIALLFLQKAKDAKRIYAEIYHTDFCFAASPRDNSHFLHNSNSKDLISFLEKFYSKIDVSPQQVEYVEANGIAVAEDDKNELEAIGEIFGNKEKPVKIGCVKSNMGNSESVSGICSVTKVCLAYNKGELPANLHYNNPHEDVEAVRDGRIEVVRENLHFERGFAALNSFSYTGTNVHVLLKGHYKEKNLKQYKTSIPYLVNVSGRNENCAERILDILATTPIDAEYIGLLHNIYKMETPGHTARGYIILGPNYEEKTRVISKSIEYCKGVKPPVCFVYSGMGSQWSGMGADLMNIPIFSAAIEKCHKVLEPKGVNIINILTSTDPMIFDDILNSFVGIAAVQIGLTDILRAIDIFPDNIIGHSTGELGCAYADGCLTAEETILSAYSRGVASKQTKMIRGAMAAVGMGYNNLKAICPPGIEIACHNSAESSTISGPVELLKDFVAFLRTRGVFAKEVACGDIAFHSKYVSTAGPALLEILQSIIKNPKQRSSKWLSTSFLQNRWNEPEATISSAEYFTNNLLSPVYFEETSKLIPQDAVVIEIAPHGLLQAIVKRSHKSCVHVPLARRGHEQPIKFLLEAIGRVYQSGLNPHLQGLYPKIEYPVATETPLLSNLVGWETSENWPVAEDVQKVRKLGQINNYIISLYDDENKFIDGYTRNGVNVIPEAFLLVLIWKTLAMSKNVDYNVMSVKFDNVYFNCEVSFGKNKYVKIKVSINKGDCNFEVTHGDILIAYGRVTDEFELEKSKQYPTDIICENDVLLSSDEIYRLLRFRGYSFNNDFQAIRSANLSLNKATVDWTGEWISYIDALLQLNVIKRSNNGISTPKLIRELIIDVKEHGALENITEKNEQHEAILSKLYDTTRCGGVTIKDIVFCANPVVQVQAPCALLTEKFWPHFSDDNLPLETALYVQMQIITENTSKNIITVTELKTTNHNMELLKGVVQNIGNFKVKTVDIKDDELRECLLASYEENDDELDVVVMYDFSANKENLCILRDVIRQDTFVLVLANNKYDDSVYKKFCTISAMGVEDGKKVLLMKKCEDSYTTENIDVIKPSPDFMYKEPVNFGEREILDANKRSIIVYDSKNDLSISGNLRYHLACLRSRSKTTNVMIIRDEEAPVFSVKDSLYNKQIRKKLMINTLKHGQWGGYYYTPVSQRVGVEEFKVTRKVPNDIGSISFEEIDIPKSISKKTIKVYYAGISQRDCQQILFEKQIGNLGIGMDFSGEDFNGQYVMGLVAESAVSSAVTADPELLWPVPRHWTLQEAATVPLPYVHAYYILSKAALVSGSRVLVLGGAGGLGQAVISICLSLDCTVFTTVSSLQKKQALLKLFPKLNENIILCCDSNHEVLLEHIVYNTNNQCCQVVISCAMGKLRETAMKCVGFSGVFLDVNRHDMELNKSFGMSYMWQCRSYKMINLSSLFEPRNDDEKRRIKRLIAEGITNGIVKPLTSITYDIEEVPRALKMLSSRNNVGRVIIKMQSPLNNVVPRMTCFSEATYLVVCVEKLLSLEFIEHLIYRGARNLIVLWSGSSTAYFLHKIRFWKQLYPTVNIVLKHLINDEECRNAVKDAEDIGSLDGVFLILDNDNNVPDKTPLMRNKNHVSMISSLDSISRTLCKDLRYFVVVSESSRNIHDEKTYLAAEKICKERQAAGFPGLAFTSQFSKEMCKSFGHLNKNFLEQAINEVLAALESSVNLKNHNIKAVIGKHVDKSNLGNKPKETDADISNVRLKTFDNNEMKVISPISFVNDNGNSATKQNTNGLGMFFSYIEKSVYELLRIPLVMMSTKAFECFEDKMEIDTTATLLILLPGFEGHHRIFKALCEPIKIRAVAVQLDTGFKSSSIQEMAATIYTSLLQKFDIRKKFYLLGYSFGVNVALEIAALLEKEGQCGIVYCLDSSPDALQYQMEAYIGNLSNDNLQNEVAAHMFSLTTGLNSQEFRKELEAIDGWYKKIEYFIGRVKGLVSYSHEYMRLLLETTYDRLVLAREYKPKYKLNSELVLIKSRATAEIVKLSDDFNLGNISEGPVKVYEVDGDHVSVLDDIQVPSIVNSSLDHELLEEFNKTNTCETYLICK